MYLFLHGHPVYHLHVATYLYTLELYIDRMIHGVDIVIDTNPVH